MDICGKTMLERVVERARCIEGIAEVVVASSTSPADDHIAGLCARRGFAFFRGSEMDVLDRYFGAARAFNAQAVVRITSDCPLLDSSISSVVVKRFLGERPDYASNILDRTFPRGLDTEIMTRAVLELAWSEAVEQPDREHVTRFIWRQPGRFRLLSVSGDRDNSRYRWTVDTQEDLLLVRRIFGEFGESNFTTDDVLALMAANPSLAAINAKVEQKKV